MKAKMKISFVVLMLIALSVMTLAQSMSFHMSSYGRGSRNFSLGYSNFGDYGYGGYGRSSFYGSFSNYGYYPSRHSSYYMPYYSSIYQQRGYYQPVVVSRPVVQSIVTTVVQRPVVIRLAVVQDDRSNGEIRNKKDQFLRMLEGKKEERIKAIEDLIGFSFDKKVEVALTEILLFDQDPEIRQLVAEALGKTNNKAFLVALEAAKKDADDGVSQEADASIRKLK